MTADFVKFCKLIDLKLERWQHDVVEEALSPRRELAVLIPRGNGKTSMMAALGLFPASPGPARRHRVRRRESRAS